jgi:hypothetical protein
MNAHELLESVRNTALDTTSLRQAVIDAEGIRFDERDITALSQRLGEFIEANRFSTDPELCVAVGSAIRKYVATMPFRDLASVANIFRASDSRRIGRDVELELSKMIARKLTVNRPAADGDFPEIADWLMELCARYLNPPLLKEEKCGAIALNACIALVLTSSRHIPSLVNRFRSLDDRWFIRVLVRRLKGIEAESTTHRIGAVQTLTEIINATPIPENPRDCTSGNLRDRDFE